jgi:hypothetical protein
LAAPDFELPPEDMIESIEMGAGYDMGRSHMSRSVSLISQAVTYGPLLSEPLQIAVDERNGAGSTLTNERIARIIAIARSEGVDVDKWLRGQLLQIAMGSAAEAKYTGIPIRTVWTDYASEGDRSAAYRACVLYAGLTPAQAETLIDQVLKRAELLVGRADVYRAILALADRLPMAGSMSGHRAARVIMDALAGDEVQGDCEEVVVSRN